MAKEGRHRFSEVRGPSVNPVTDLTMPEVMEGLRAEPRDAQVYFVRRGDFIKIGCTRRLGKRLAALRSYRDPSGAVGPVRLLVTVPGGKITEGYLHYRFRDSSVDGFGEWFYADVDVLAFVLFELHAEKAARGSVESRAWVVEHLRALWERASTP